PVKALGIATGVVLDLQHLDVIDLDLVVQPVRVLIYVDAGGDCLLGLEVVGGQFEAVVPQVHLADTHLLVFFPAGNARIRTVAALLFVKDNGAAAGQLGVASGRVGDDQGVPFGRVSEVVEYPLVFHQTADKGEVGLAVLHTV